MTSPTCARRGLTLIELMVALAISGIAISAGYTALGTLIDRRGAVDDVTADVTRAWTVRTTLTSWIEEARANAPGAFRALDARRDDIPDDDFSFVTSARTPLGDGETAVHLHIARDSAGVALALVADLAEWRGTRRMTVVVDSAVAGLDVRFRSGFVRRGEWLTSWISSSLLPNAVELRLISSPSLGLDALLREPVLVVLGGV